MPARKQEIAVRDKRVARFGRARIGVVLAGTALSFGSALLTVGAVPSAVLGLAAIAGQARAQLEPTAPEEAEPTELLADFVHFIQINQPELAEVYGAEMLARGFEPREFLGFVEDSGEIDRFLDAVSRARQNQLNENLREIADRLDQLYEQGRLAKARDPREVDRNISLLTGQLRGRVLARQRLVTAGEYAMPQLLNALLQTQDVTLRAEARGVIVDMGRQAIMPLAAALPELTPEQQVTVIETLAQIEYETWIPFVYELEQESQNPRVRQTAQEAIGRLTRGQPLSGDVAYWYYDLAERFYDEKAEVTSFPGEDFQLVWEYDAGLGLIAQAIRTEVFHEAMAMRLAEQSLGHRTAENDALPLWLASNFSRQLDTPTGYDNPLYPASRPEAMYYAVSFGDAQSQWVLGRAMDDRDTPLARLAISAIEQTAGAEAMRRPIYMRDSSGADVERRPLIEALSYPNRRVQFEAAIALGTSQPMVDFEGAERVVPILASATRDAASRIAVVVSSDAERRDELRRLMEQDDYTVFAGASIADLEAPLAGVTGVDAIVAAAGQAELRVLVDQVRRDPRLLATPVLAVVPSLDYPQADRSFRRDATVEVRQEGTGVEQLSRTLAGLIERASGGPISANEAQQYATRSLDVLRDLAVSGNAVLDVADAALPLMASLEDTSGGIRLQIGTVLSRINQARVQSALFEAALSSRGIERIELMRETAGSAKRFGALLDPNQVDRLRDVVGTASGLEATAAAALLGSLGLPVEDVLPLVLDVNAG